MRALYANHHRIQHLRRTTFRTRTSVAFVGLDKLRSLVGYKVFHPLDEQPIAHVSVNRRVVARAYRIKLFLPREGFNEGPVMQPVFVKLEQLSSPPPP